MKFFIFLIISLLPFKVFSQDVYVSTNKNSCIGLALSLINSDTNYITVKNLPNSLPPSLAQKPYDDQSKFGKLVQYKRQLFNNLISK